MGTEQQQEFNSEKQTTKQKRKYIPFTDLYKIYLFLLKEKRILFCKFFSINMYTNEETIINEVK